MLNLVNRMISLLSVAVILNMVSSQLPCSHNEQSYCLSGLNIGDVNDQICTQYIYAGTFNNCSYFKSVDNLHLFYEPQYNTWDIDVELGGGLWYSYCTEPNLNDCISGKWRYYDGQSDYINYAMILQPCSYDNTDCLQTYSQNDSHCIANTGHRDFNSAIRGQYVFKGCHMSQPYFIQSVNFTSVELGIINFTLQWDDILSAWHISSALASAGSHFAYCIKTDLNDCNENWYIFDGTSSSVDRQVKSGYCNNCIENIQHEEICIIGGIIQNRIIGRYKYEKCDQLNPFYRSVTDARYTLQYSAWGDEYRIIESINDNNYIDARCNGSDIDICIRDDEQWSVWNGSSLQYELMEGFQTSQCNDVNGQCNVNYDYCLNVYDAAYESYGGTYNFLSCDNNGYPIFHQYKNMNGEYGNFSVIKFDNQSVEFHIRTNDGQSTPYAWCNGLMIDTCQGFWLPNSRNFTMFKCNETQGETVWEQYWFIFVIIIPFVVIVVVVVFMLLWKRKLTTRNDTELAALVDQDGNRQRSNTEGCRSETDYH